MDKIGIFGSYPPPYGGISVHIKRLHKLLQNNGIAHTCYANSDRSIIESNVVNVKSVKKLILRLPFCEEKILHFHYTNDKIIILLPILKLFGKKLIFTNHGYKYAHSDSPTICKLALHAYKAFDKVICVNKSVGDDLIRLGVKKEKVEIIPAYINPIEDEEELKDIPDYVWKFIDKAKFLITANGCIRFYNNYDLYGMDKLIELMQKLKAEGYNINLLIALLEVDRQNKNERQYYEQLKEKIKIYELEENIMIFEVKDTVLYPLLKRSDLFLRPTVVDGYGVSIAEALYYKVPSIASDVCIRPEGTIIFKSGNIDDLYKKTVDVINNYEIHKERLYDYIVPDNADKILRIYKELESKA